MSRIPPPPPPPPAPPLAPATENPLFDVRSDTGPFHTLGTQFSCNKSRWIGKAVISPTALYLLKKSKNIANHHTGIAGALISAGISKVDNISTCTAADLPDTVRAQLAPKKRLAKKSVVIVPQSTVSFVKCAPLSNAITITAGPDEFTVLTSFFKIFSNQNTLISLGWPINTPLEPTAEPVHDARPDEERAQPSTRPLWQKVLLIAAGLALFAAFIALRVLTGAHPH